LVGAIIILAFAGIVRDDLQQRHRLKEYTDQQYRWAVGLAGLSHEVDDELTACRAALEKGKTKLA